MTSSRPIKVALFAGERSGDHCGAALIRALKATGMNFQFEGVAGPGMRAEGCKAILPTEAFSVMGIVRVLKALPRLFLMRLKLLKQWRQSPPDIFIGIDYPDFNLGLERKLKRSGVKTVHYVSPSVWAWRAGRIKTIRKACDLMLALFPFEVPFYENAGVPVRCIGHPLADAYPLEANVSDARGHLGFQSTDRYVALLPGSRTQEVHALAERFIETADWCWRRSPELQFIMPLARSEHVTYVQTLLAARQVPVRVILGHADKALTASDAALIASGTATLEALFTKTPMVIAYRLPAVTYWIAKKLVKLTNVGLPNILAGETLVPEFIQEQAQAEAMGQAVLDYLHDPERVSVLRQRFAEIHQGLRKSGSTEAARAIVELLATESET